MLVRSWLFLLSDHCLPPRLDFSVPVEKKVNPRQIQLPFENFIGWLRKGYIDCLGTIDPTVRP